MPERLRMSVGALGLDGQRWLDELPAVLASLEADWGIAVGAGLGRGNAAYLAEAVTADGHSAVVKVALPPGISGFAPFAGELAALLAGDGDPYVEVLNHDEDRRAVLLERLGRPLAEFGWSTSAQLTAIAETVSRGWHKVEVGRLETGDTKARLLGRSVAEEWEQLGRPCSERAIERAVAYATERALRFDITEAVLVHGDAHPNNVLEAGRRGDGAIAFKLTDPEGLLSEPAHDLGVVLRGWNDDLLAGDTVRLAHDLCAQVAAATGVDGRAIWQWSFIERVSSGLFLLQLGHNQEAREFLQAADRLAERHDS